MLKTSSIESAKSRKSGIEFDSGSRAKRDRSEIDGDVIDGSEFINDKIRKKIQKTSKSKNLFKSKKTVESSDFLTFGAKLAFTKLK